MITCRPFDTMVIAASAAWRAGRSGVRSIALARTTGAAADTAGDAARSAATGGVTTATASGAMSGVAVPASDAVSARYFTAGAFGSGWILASTGAGEWRFGVGGTR